jgi:DNA repair protein RadA/Sms
MNMTNVKSVRRCEHCGARMPAGDKMRCVECKRWNSPEEGNIVDDSKLASEEPEQPFRRIITTFDTIDELWGRPEEWGVVTSSVSLIGGAPGAGKSTLSLQLATLFAEYAAKTVEKQASGKKREVMYIASEENRAQVTDRAKRLGTPLECLRIVDMNSQGSLKHMILKHRPCSIFVDSMAGMTSNPDVAVETSKRFKEYATTLDCPVFIITHANKADEIAGLLALQHAPDVVMTLFAPFKDSELRVMTSLKNRFGPANYVRWLLMTERGLVATGDPTAAGDE